MNPRADVTEHGASCGPRARAPREPERAGGDQDDAIPDEALPGDEGRGGEEWLRYHVPAARAMVKGEHRLAEYVARLDLGERARIPGASPIPLPTLAVWDPASRVGGTRTAASRR